MQRVTSFILALMASSVLLSSTPVLAQDSSPPPARAKSDSTKAKPKSKVWEAPKAKERIGPYAGAKGDSTNTIPKAQRLEEKKEKLKDHIEKKEQKIDKMKARLDKLDKKGKSGAAPDSTKR